MKAVIQRVSKASVTVDGTITGAINNGLLVLLGIHRDDNEVKLNWVTDKILKLRIFEDDDGKMNRSVTDVGGGILVVSQFTLYGELKKGTRPGFINAAPPEISEPVYEKFINRLKSESDLKIESGIFGAMMNVELVNQGPVTIIIEK